MTNLSVQFLSVVPVLTDEVGQVVGKMSYKPGQPGSWATVVTFVPSTRTGSDVPPVTVGDGCLAMHNAQAKEAPACGRSNRTLQTPGRRERSDRHQEALRVLPLRLSPMGSPGLADRANWSNPTQGQALARPHRQTPSPHGVIMLAVGSYGTCSNPRPTARFTF